MPFDDEKRGKLDGLYFILNVGAEGFRELPFWLEGVIANGARLVQVRGKDIHPAKLAAMTRSVIEIAKKYRASVIVNDFPEIAMETEALGVHLGSSDKSIREVREEFGDKLLIGATVRTLAKARKAIDQGADYIAVGAMFRSPTKPRVKVVGIDTLKEICDSSPEIPICAIGGINLGNIAQVIKAGADIAAVVSAIEDSDNPEKSTIGLAATFGLRNFVKLDEECLDDLDLDD